MVLSLTGIAYADESNTVLGYTMFDDTATNAVPANIVVDGSKTVRVVDAGTANKALTIGLQGVSSNVAIGLGSQMPAGSFSLQFDMQFINTVSQGSVGVSNSSGKKQTYFMEICSIQYTVRMR